MALLDWEQIGLNTTVDEEQLWKLLAAAQEQVQEMAHAVWTQAGKLNRSSGFASIREMIPAPHCPHSNMPLRVQLKFFRTRAQRLRRTADFISSDLVSTQCAPQNGPLVSTQCAPQIQTGAHFPQQSCLRDLQPHYRPDSSTANYFHSPA